MHEMQICPHCEEKTYTGKYCYSCQYTNYEKIKEEIKASEEKYRQSNNKSKGESSKKKGNIEEAAPKSVTSWLDPLDFQKIGSETKESQKTEKEQNKKDTGQVNDDTDDLHISYQIGEGKKQVYDSADEKNDCDNNQEDIENKKEDGQEDNKTDKLEKSSLEDKEETVDSTRIVNQDSSLNNGSLNNSLTFERLRKIGRESENDSKDSDICVEDENDEIENDDNKSVVEESIHLNAKKLSNVRETKQPKTSTATNILNRFRKQEEEEEKIIDYSSLSEEELFEKLSEDIKEKEKTEKKDKDDNKISEEEAYEMDRADFLDADPTIYNPNYDNYYDDVMPEELSRPDKTTTGDVLKVIGMIAAVVLFLVIMMFVI